MAVNPLDLANDPTQEKGRGMKDWFKVSLLVIIVLGLVNCGKDKTTNGNINPNGGDGGGGRAELTWTQIDVSRFAFDCPNHYGTTVTGIVRNDTDYTATGLKVFFVFTGNRTFQHSFVNRTVIRAHSGNVEISAQSCGYHYSELERTFIIWD